MIKKYKLLGIVFLVVVFTWIKIFNSQMTSLVPGCSKSQVSQRVGTPYKIQKSNSAQTEIWSYSSYPFCNIFKEKDSTLSLDSIPYDYGTWQLLFEKDTLVAIVLVGESTHIDSLNGQVEGDSLMEYCEKFPLSLNSGLSESQLNNAVPSANANQ